MIISVKNLFGMTVTKNHPPTNISERERTSNRQSRIVHEQVFTPERAAIFPAKLKLLNTENTSALELTIQTESIPFFVPSSFDVP